MIQTVADSPGDETALSLIYSCKTPFDILLDEDLGEYEKAGKLFYFPLVQSPDEQWELADGYVTASMIENIMPTDDDSLIIVCGPDRMKMAVKEVLDNMGLTNYFIFN